MCCSLLLLPGAAFLELVLIKATGNQNSLTLKFQNHQNHLNVTNHVSPPSPPTTTTAVLNGSACSVLPGKHTDRPESYISMRVSTCCFLLVIFPPQNFCTHHKIDIGHRRNHSASTGTFLPVTPSLPFCSAFDHPLMQGVHNLILEPHEPRGRHV